MQNIINSKSIEEKKQSAVWSNKPIYGSLPKNIGVPPYHGRCRTILEPVWLREEEIEGKTVRYVDKKDGDILTHIDNTDKQRRVDKKTFGHSDSSRARKVPLKDVISAFNSIKEIAPHFEKKDMMVALSRNGYFMMFKDDYLYTIMKEPRKNYFKDNAIKEKLEVIKWKNTTSTYAMDGQLRISSILTRILNLMK